MASTSRAAISSISAPNYDPFAIISHSSQLSLTSLGPSGWYCVALMLMGVKRDYDHTFYGEIGTMRNGS